MRLLAAFAIFAALGARAQPPETLRTPVVVELFTSEGCSSCPPADRLLAELEAQPVPGAEIIPLGLHVDYWNQLGWKDRFSSHDFSVLQESYAEHLGIDSPYTPQMVVDGVREFVGSSRSDAIAAIRERASGAHSVTAVLQRLAGDRFSVNVSGAPADAQLFIAITEDALQTSVRGGENGGATLRHVAVVRQLRPLAFHNGENAEFHPVLQPDWKRADIRIVAFVQAKSSLAILAAATTKLQ